MIDFVKIRIRGGHHRHYRRTLRRHSVLHWRDPIHAVDHPPRGCTAVAEWGNAFKFYAKGDSVCEIRGSFHKFYKGDNWQDFTHAQFCAAVDDFCGTFGIFPGALRILNLEVGVNIVPPIPTCDFLPRVLLHRTQRPNVWDPPMIGIEIRHEGHYRYKIYCKATQYGLPGELMRIEIHVDRMAILHPYGVHTVADLLRVEVWEALRAFLLAKFDELLIAEGNIDPEGLTRPQLELLAKAGTVEYWEGLSANKRHRSRTKVERLWRQHARPHLKGAVQDAIANKTAELIAAQREGGTFDATCARACEYWRHSSPPLSVGI